ncbi:MAG TPA: hypothetical protein VH598_00665, partial [Verrucomicrobiae bacterium]|nr:hypothetical protein [Verrucomicrobiae bacterium]
MIPEDSGQSRNGGTRRQFIKRTGKVATVVAGASLFNLPVLAGENRESVSIVLDPADAVVKQAPVQWAAEQLRDALAARGVTAQFCENLDQAPPSRECVLVTSGASILARQIVKPTGISSPEAPEAMALVRGKIGTRALLLAAGSDA